MISVVLYGRNDNYGYNLHKRGALSLNCIAEILDETDDEIIFVDYNTPNDRPTFPEAIHDTLTAKAKTVLRILRARPSIHQRYGSKSHLVVLEPIARNIAVRRSNPDNRWILSTNTDMIFVPQRQNNLNGIVSALPNGFYHAPRIEIPEHLWESLDRQKSQDAIATIRNWGRTLHIDEIVLGPDIVRYDGPGDFQLIRRADLFDIQAFDERMLLGWHVDSNIAKRLSLIYGAVGDLGLEVFGYHCDHTRQVTPMHDSVTHLQNDWTEFVAKVQRADIPEQAKTWGCADDEIEEIRLQTDSAKVYATALIQAIGDPLKSPAIVRHTADVYDKVDYDPKHLLPFLVDLFINAPRNSNLAWYGARADTLAMFADVWRELGFTGKIVTDRSFIDEAGLAQAGVSVVPEQTIDAEVGAFIFDFGGLTGGDNSKSSDPPRKVSDGLRSTLLHIVRKERHRMASDMPPRRIVTLNTINNSYEGFVLDLVAAGLTPFSTRMRHGFVRSAKKGIAKRVKDILGSLRH